MRINYRNLSDLDETIRNYEVKYGITSVDMLKDTSARSRISEAELLKWEAYLTQRRRVLNHNDEVRRQYLSSRTEATASKHSVTYDPAKYAA
jgi:hypothetical protein